jgi:V/A-type H+-transporting ATPase subunit K
MESPVRILKKRIAASILILLGIIGVGGALFSVEIYAQQQEAGAAAVLKISPEQAQVSKFALIAAAVAFGFGALGAGIAISGVGAAAMGAVAEKPEVAGQALIFVALAEGLVVFGFITALMILGKV